MKNFYNNILFYISIVVLANVSLKAETYDSNFNLAAGTSATWRDLNVFVKPENAATGTTLRFIRNSISVVGDLPEVGSGQPLYDNVLLNGSGCRTGSGCLGVTLDMDQTNFSFTNNTQLGDRIQVRDRVSFVIQNNSIFNASRITAANGGETDFYLNITNSNFTINQIDFTNGNSNRGFIREFLIKNDTKESAKLTIINGLRNTASGSNNYIAIDLGADGLIPYIDVTNGILDVRGDIKVGKGIDRISLNNSSFLFSGITLDNVGTINLTSNSIMKSSRRAGINLDSLMIMQGGVINVDSSEFEWHNIRMNTTSRASFNTILKKAKFTVKDITYFDNLIAGVDKNRLEFKISATDASTIVIEDIELNGIWQPNSSGNFFLIEGDGTSTYNINSISLSDNNVAINLFDNNIKIANFNYGNTNLVLNGLAGKKVVTMGTINVNLPTVNVASVTFNNMNIYSDNVNFNNANSVTFNFQNSFGYLGNITCNTSCNTVGFNNANNVEISSFNTKTDATNTNMANFINSSLKITKDFKYSGNITLQNSNINIGAVSGQYTNIAVNNSTFTIGQGSSILMNAGGVLGINSSSTLNINGENTFQGTNSRIENSGTLNISARNNINTLLNSGVLNLKSNGSVIETLNNSKDLNLYGNNRIGNLVSTAGNINLYNTVSFGNINLQNSKINLYIDDVVNYGSINADRIENLVLDNSVSSNGSRGINVFFTNTTILKPGLYNRFNLITSTSNIIPIAEADFNNTFSILPPWIKADCTTLNDGTFTPVCKEQLKDNNGNLTGGEVIYTNIIRLTDYKRILENVPYYSNDTEALLVAESIDRILKSENIGNNIIDIINSLDFNSGCITNETIESGHNGANLTVENAPCIVNMAQNINTLKAINNEIFLISMHDNMSLSRDAIINSNMNYYGLEESDLWINNSFSYNILQDRNYVSGNNKASYLMQIGRSGSVSQNINGTIGGAIVVSSLEGNNNLYSSKEVGGNIGGALTYEASVFGNTLYLSAASLYGFSYYLNERNSDFLNNRYSVNKNTVASSANNVQEFLFTIESGLAFAYDTNLKDSKFYIVPKVSSSYGYIFGSNYIEEGSSAMLAVEGFNNSLIEIVAGIEIYQEFLLERFLMQEYGFWTPKLGFNLISRNYGDVNTSYNFVNQDNYKINANQGNYDAQLAMQSALSLNFLKENINFKVEYKFEMGIDSYINNNLMAIFRYSF